MSKYATSQVFDLVKKELLKFGFKEETYYFDVAQDTVMFILDNPELRQKDSKDIVTYTAQKNGCERNRTSDNIRQAMHRARMRGAIPPELDKTSKEFTKEFLCYVADRVLQQL